MPNVPSHPSEIEAGDRVQIRYGASSVIALVEAVLPPSEMRLRAAGATLEGEVLVRWLDEQGSAWRAQALATTSGDGCEVSLHLLGEWQQDQMRASQRISGSRHSLRGEVQAGSLPPGSRLDLVCLDISASGCRASGVGRVPQPGDILRLCCIHPFEDERWLQARVMRVSRLPFGRFELGFQFDVQTNAERVWLAAWRDAWAYVSRSEEPATGADEPGEASDRAA